MSEEIKDNGVKMTDDNGELSAVSSQSTTEDALTESEIKTMEVHHHPQVEKKSFKEYLLEGLMIFIAVSMGFFAENIRESISDNEQGKEYAISLVRNLKEDTAYLSMVIAENKGKLEGLKDLVRLSQKDLSSPQTRQELYKYSSQSIAYYSMFKSNDATLQQLKNSGGLRFIRKAHASDSIAKLIVETEAIYSAEKIYLDATNAAMNASHEILDKSVYYDSTYFLNDKFTNKTLPLLTNDNNKQKQFFNKIVSEIGATNLYIKNMEKRKPYFVDLIAFLQKEYHLEKE